MAARNIVIGSVAAAAALMLVPGVAPAVAKAAKPLARRGARAAARAWRELRETGAEAYEHMEDLAAEIRADLAEEDVEPERAGAAPGAEPREDGG